MKTEYIESLLGIPYRELGRDRNGLDCLGVVLLVYREQYGIEIPDPASLENCTVTRAISRYFRQITSLPQVGDLVRIDDPEMGDHLGIWLQEGIIHATRNGVVIWPHRHIVKIIKGIYRHVDN